MKRQFDAIALAFKKKISILPTTQNVTQDENNKKNMCIFLIWWQKRTHYETVEFATDNLIWLPTVALFIDIDKIWSTHREQR